MRTNSMCVLMCAAGAVGWGWISSSAFVAGVALAVGLCASLREPEEERKSLLLVADALVPGSFLALVHSVFLPNLWT